MGWLSSNGKFSLEVSREVANRYQLASQWAEDSAGLNIQSGSLSWPVDEVGYWLRVLLGLSTIAPKPGFPMCFSQPDSWVHRGSRPKQELHIPRQLSPSCKAYYDLSTEAQNIPSTFSRKCKSVILVQVQGAGNETLNCMWEWQDHIAEVHRGWESSVVTTSVQFSSSAQSRPILWPHGLQHARLPCPSPAPGVYSNSCPSSQWCHPTISSSVVPFFSHLQSFPASGSFPMRQFFASGGQSIGVSGSASVLPINIQDWFPLGWTGWISLQSKVTISGKYNWPRPVT